MADARASEFSSYGRHNFLKPGFIFDTAFSLAALTLTPVILRLSDDAKRGHGSAAFGWILIGTAAAEIVALTIVLPHIFRKYRKNSSGPSLFFFWIAHFCLHIMFAVTIILPAMGWPDPSTKVGILMGFFVAKEFYVGALLGYAAGTSDKEPSRSPRVIVAAQAILAAAAFLYYTAVFEGMSHAEILEGIDPNIADYFAYKVFHFGFMFFLIYFPARMVFVLEDRMSAEMNADRWRFRAGLFIAMVGGTWALYTGPEILPSDITAREERFGQSRLMEHISYAPLGYLERLIDAGVDVNARDHKGRTALHKAAYNGRISAARLLLSHKADPNAVTHEGLTPLMATFHPGWSGLQGRLEITRLLLMSGAHPDLRDKAGRKFTDYVEYQFRGHVTELLREKNTPPR